MILPAPSGPAATLLAGGRFCVGGGPARDVTAPLLTAGPDRHSGDHLCAETGRDVRFFDPLSGFLSFPCGAWRVSPCRSSSFVWHVMCNHFLHDQRYPRARKGCSTGKVGRCAVGSRRGAGFAGHGSFSRPRGIRASGQPARSSRGLAASHSAGESAERTAASRDNTGHHAGDETAAQG